jgi:hypothetical protein
MAVGVFSPAVPDSANSLMLGEGAIFKNYGEAGEAALGATVGGSKLEVDRKINPVKYDGSYGHTKNMKRYDTFEPKLTVKFLKLTYTNMVQGLPTTVTDGTDKDGAYKEISFDIEIAAADVLTNIAFVGQKYDGGEAVILIENALNLGKISLDFKEKNELVAEMEYTGFYGYATPTVPPLLISDEIV